MTKRLRRANHSADDELWGGPAPDGFCEGGRVLTYSHYESGEAVRTSPIFENDLDRHYECSIHGTLFRTITDEAMERIGAESDEHLHDYQHTHDFFAERTDTGSATTECGQKFCCGGFYHDVIEDQYDYCCAERDCGHAHYPSYFNYGGYCWECEECDQEYECDECEEKAEVEDTDDVSGDEEEEVARPKLTLVVLSSGMSDAEDGEEDEEDGLLTDEVSAELPTPLDFLVGGERRS